LIHRVVLGADLLAGVRYHRKEKDMPRPGALAPILFEDIIQDGRWISYAIRHLWIDEIDKLPLTLEAKWLYALIVSQVWAGPILRACAKPFRYGPCIEGTQTKPWFVEMPAEQAELSVAQDLGWPPSQFRRLRQEILAMGLGWL